MKREDDEMNRNRWLTLSGIIIVIVVVVVGAAVWRSRGGPPPTTPAQTAGPVAQVQTTLLRRSQIEETLTAYGLVVATPGESRTFSVPFESQVRKVFVTGGETLRPETPLVEIEPSPDARLLLDQARIELNSGRNQLELTKQRLQLKLATRQELLQAEQRVHDAEARAQNMLKRGVDGPRTIRSDSTGIVNKIAVQVGQIVPPGTVLVEAIDENRITVQLGIESEDVARVQEGQAVRLSPVNGPDRRPVEGRVRLIARQVNPQTRLVDLFVTPAFNSRMVLNQYIQGQIVIAAQDALVAPRGAALPEGDHYVLYTVQNGKAVRHTVRLGLENPSQVEVIGGALQPGEPVVVVGASELQDGMTVQPVQMKATR
jgi:RND family efflux transporter MFP subunit